MSLSRVCTVGSVFIDNGGSRTYRHAGLGHQCMRSRDYRHHQQTHQQDTKHFYKISIGNRHAASLNDYCKIEVPAWTVGGALEVSFEMKLLTRTRAPTAKDSPGANCEISQRKAPYRSREAMPRLPSVEEKSDRAAFLLALSPTGIRANFSLADLVLASGFAG